MRPISLGLSLFLATVVLAQPVSASAEDPATVKLTRRAPFDQWCVAPVCTARDAAPAPVPRQAVPDDVELEGTTGLADQRLRQALAEKIVGLALEVAGSWNNAAVRDLLGAAAAAASEDTERLARAKGLGGAVLRAGLVYQLADAMVTDPACVDAARTDALYEGLALSISLAPLSFPQATGQVPAACEQTALRAAHWADSVVLVALLPAAWATELSQLAEGIDGAAAACATVTEPGELLAAVQALRAAKAAPTIASVVAALSAVAQIDWKATEGDAACAKALAGWAGDHLPHLRAVVQKGLGGAQAKDVAVTLQTGMRVACPAGNCDALVALAQAVARMAKGEATPKAELQKLLAVLHLGAGNGHLPELLGVLFDALRASLQTAGHGFSIHALASALGKQVGIDETGHVSLLALLHLPQSPWIAEIGLAVPKLSGGELSLGVNARAGYAAQNLGVVARVGLDTYDIANGAQLAETTHAGAGLDLWAATANDEAPRRYEFQWTNALDLYDTTQIPWNTKLAGLHFFNENSVMFRSTLLLGAKFGTPWDRWQVQARLGAGLQVEAAESIKVENGIGAATALNASGQTQGRLLVRWRAIPRVLGMHAYAAFQRFTFAQAQAAVQFDGTLSGSVQLALAQQTQTQTRIFLDADALAFAEFVPAVFVGLDTIAVAGAPEAVFAPVIGAGIVRTRW